MDDPAKQAEAMIDAYRHNFVGRVGPAARSVANRYTKTPETEDSVVGIRGPYLQALDIPNWSDRSWQEFCRDENVSPLIQDAFSDLGFRRLYRFQERTVSTVKDGHDTVVTAGTGRGKTEAWLIPILDQILEEKRNEDQPRVKALLIYPTKALAQDQFKRLVQYLYRINEKWPSSEQITVGIYDGDTPSDVSANAQGYLQSSFKYFECPGRNEELEKCRTCGQGVRIHHAGQQYELQPEKRQCTDDVPLNFIKLTKHRIRNEGVDILLTNPDTINRKLVNVNAPDEHNTFIYDPEFLVFDEVHTYDGLFGSFTAMLTKRIRALRRRRECGDLQVIASSATVDNDVELFRKISGAKSIEHVDEQPRNLDPSKPLSLPRELTEDTIETADLLTAARNDDGPDVLNGLTFDVDSSHHDDERLRELFQDAVFDYLTSESEDPVVNAMQYLHQELATDPRPYDEFLTLLQSTFDLQDATAGRVLENFQTLGVFSGILENRTHLFSWPIDGFYACTACDAVYRSPQETCANCGFGFVTRSTYCRACADEAVIAWYCPRCEQLEPYQPGDEGEHSFENEHHCQRCLQSVNETVRSLRVTFHPRLVCVNCGHVEKRTQKRECNECGSDMIHTEPHTYTCSNPACESTEAHETGCARCGSTQRPQTGMGPITCTNCGRSHEGKTTCSCGQELNQTRLIPWVCRNENCDRTYFDSPPATCDCGSSHIMAKRGLFEVFEDRYCEECETAFVDERTCNCTGNAKERIGIHESFKTFEPDGSIRSVSSTPTVAPCRHAGLPYSPGNRYDELMRGPGNLAVTTSQYMLRRVADQEGFESAKQLSFADSHRDMKELDRDFREPEVGTLLDQCLVESIQERTGQWVSLATVFESTLERIDDLHKELAPPQDVQSLTFDLRAELIDTARQGMDETETAIKDRLCRRAIPHRYSPRYREFGGALAEVGVLDFRLEPSVAENLSRLERQIATELVKTGNDVHVEALLEETRTSRSALEAEIEGSDWICNEDGFVAFAPEAIQLTIAGDDDNLWYDPTSGTFSHSIVTQLGLKPDSAVSFETSLLELADPSDPHFDSRAYRLVYSRTRILLSRVYHGLTDKRERRELEYLFREGNYPNFLSSGPTMELGVDIGALDSLLLYGTPPNMNAYLQRIGRAGRSSNTSLVHSVSQRNPIDYYYYDQPTDLMAADPQPVPLKEFNREVVRISLTWAVFDYIAANFVIPWTVEKHGKYKSVSDGDIFDAKQPELTDDAAKLTHVMSARTKALGLDSDRTQFDVLGTIVHDYRSEIESYLRSMLQYKYCPLCSRKYELSEPNTRCENDDCNGTLINAIEAYGNLASEAVDEFATRYLHSFEDYHETIESEIDELSRQTERIKHDKQSAGSRREARRLRKEQEELLDRKTALEEQQKRIKNISYVDFLRESRQSRYAFDMRTVEESVPLQLIDSDENGYTTRTVGDEDGRTIRMAIQELHPKAAYLDNGNTYVVSHLSTDDYESTELRKRVRTAGAANLAETFLCPSCNLPSPTRELTCDCDTDEGTQLKLVSPANVTAHRSDLLLSNGQHPARTVYERANSEIQNTYTERETEVLSFNPDETYSIQTADGRHIGSLTYGSYTVLVHADSFRAKYKTGAIDSEASQFEFCGDPDCTGVIYHDHEDKPHCTADADHRPDGAEGSLFLRLGYAYETDGIRADLGNSGATHAFAHGVRLALQFLGGVSIRDLTEVVHENTSEVDIFDSQEGGAGIARLLVADADGENFQSAIELMREQFVCDCRDGCPHCLYQYGCATRNRGSTFDSEEIVELLRAHDLELVELDQ